MYIHRFSSLISGNCFYIFCCFLPIALYREDVAVVGRRKGKNENRRSLWLLTVSVLPFSLLRSSPLSGRLPVRRRRICAIYWVYQEVTGVKTGRSLVSEWHILEFSRQEADSPIPIQNFSPGFILVTSVTQTDTFLLLPQNTLPVYNSFLANLLVCFIIEKRNYVREDRKNDWYRNYLCISGHY